METTEKKALIKEVQRDPVTHKIIHIDLGEIKNQGEIETEVPIQYIGKPITVIDEDNVIHLYYNKKLIYTYKKNTSFRYNYKEHS